MVVGARRSPVVLKWMLLPPLPDDVAFVHGTNEISSMQVRLTDKTVLVTGASRGIGRAIAKAAAEAGARVAVHYRREQEQAEALADALGGETRAFQADLAEPAACTKLWHEVTGHYGRVDVLVNNAGVAVSLPLDADDAAWQEGWDRTMAVNLRAPELLARLALRHFVKNGGGRIINVASRAAFRGDTPEYAAYAASKGGLIALTRTIARGYGKRGVKAFALAPGFTHTDMAQDFIDAYGENWVLDDLALDTLTRPEDIAPLAVLLASGLADHATGTTIDVNAGSYVH